ncbi:polyketide cyclase [Actinophytocola sp. NPDC049390]|uniref:polyketide cyclase n=1 Tax=Actinophytocola sp. NPDC049390 TaxID=3363894 RepID=UPI00379787C1
MTLNDYWFRSVWSVRVPTGRLYSALVDLACYPDWWPDIRAVTRVDDDTAEVTCRSVLPYSLRFRLHRAVEDETAGRMRVDMTGDLEGYVQGEVAAHRAGALLAITQRVAVTKPLLRALAPVGRPVFRANHALMMWRGQRGLRAYLAS